MTYEAMDEDEAFHYTCTILGFGGFVLKSETEPSHCFDLDCAQVATVSSFDDLKIKAELYVTKT